MQVKFELSKETKGYFQPDGKHYLVANKSGNILLTIDELIELNGVLGKTEHSKAEFKRVVAEER